MLPELKKESLTEKEMFDKLLKNNEFFRDYKPLDFNENKFRTYTEFLCTLNDYFLFIKEEYILGEPNPVTYRYYLYKLSKQKK